MLKKKVLIGLVLLIFLSGLIVFIVNYCFKWQEVEIKLDSGYNELFTQDEIIKKGHVKIIPEYSSDVSICYKNTDGTKTLYVYSSPIRYLNSNGQFTMIDTRIANLRNREMRDKGYVYTIASSDIKPLYPRKLSENNGIIIQGETEYEFGIDNGSDTLCKYTERNNFINEKKRMSLYRGAGGNGIDIQLYPSSLGSNCEILYNKKPKSNVLYIWLNVYDSDVKIKKEPGGYIVMTKNDGENENIIAVIQKPLLKSKNGMISYNSIIEIEKKENGKYRLQCIFDNKYLDEGSSAFISFEMRRNNQPDNALYSNFPDMEYAYLRNYSVIGKSNDYGIGRLMIRYKFVRFFNLSTKNIYKAQFSTYSLTKNNDALEMVSVLEDWCSMTGNWNKQYETGDRTSYLENKVNEINFDITEEVKNWCNEETGQMEHNGVLLKSVSEQSNLYNVILSNDNTLYRNRTEIILTN